MIAAVALACSMTLGPGPHTVAAFVCYEHEDPAAPGTTYHAADGGLYWGPLTLDVEAEGAPCGVVWVVSGVRAQACGQCPTMFPPWIFADDFESGTTERWEVGS